MSLSLEELQRRMAELLTDEAGPQGRSMSFVLKGKVERGARLSVYANGYFIRLTEALEVDYKAVLRVLGKETFQKLVFDYLKRYPSETENIAEVGSRLANFIVESSWGKGHPFLADLARLEWLAIEAFWALEVDELDVSKLSTITPEVWSDCSFVVDPSLRLLKTKFPVDEIWQGEATMVGEQDSFLCLFRSDDEIWVQSLEAQEFHLLDLVSRGLTFSEICDGCVGVFPSVGDTIGAFQSAFAGWVSDGILKDVRLPLS